MVQPFGWFSKALGFHGHGFWYVCKVALNAPSLLPYTIECTPINNIERSHNFHTRNKMKHIERAQTNQNSIYNENKTRDSIYFITLSCGLIATWCIAMRNKEGSSSITHPSGEHFQQLSCVFQSVQRYFKAITSTIMCVIKWHLRIGFLFTHTNYLGFKSHHKSIGFFLFFLNSSIQQPQWKYIFHVFCYHANKHSKQCAMLIHQLRAT